MLKLSGFLPKGDAVRALGHNNFIGDSESDRLADTGGLRFCKLEGIT